MPRWTKVRPGMTSHRLRLPNLISSTTHRHRHRPSSGTTTEEFNIYPEMGPSFRDRPTSPYRIVRHKRTTDPDAVHSGTVQYCTSTRPSHLWRGRILARRHQCTCFSIFCTGTIEKWNCPNVVQLISIYLLPSPRSMQSGSTGGQCRRSALEESWRHPPAKQVRHSLPNENLREYTCDHFVTSQLQRAMFNLRSVPLQQACAPLLPIQGY